jgi:hypothetical protein
MNANRIDAVNFAGVSGTCRECGQVFKKSKPFGIQRIPHDVR